MGGRCVLDWDRTRPSRPPFESGGMARHAYGPRASGKLRHGEPVRRIQMMPSTTCRRSRGGRPVRSGAANTSEIKSHCSCVSRCRSMMNSFSSTRYIMTSVQESKIDEFSDRALAAQNHGWVAATAIYLDRSWAGVYRVFRHGGILLACGFRRCPTANFGARRSWTGRR